MLAWQAMRLSLGQIAIALASCASTVYRTPGEPITPGGTARSACESEDWLVLAPTRAEVADEGKGTSHPVSGLGLYRVGSDSPESIPSLDLPPSQGVEKKRERL